MNILLTKWPSSHISTCWSYRVLFKNIDPIDLGRQNILTSH